MSVCIRPLRKVNICGSISMLQMTSPRSIDHTSHFSQWIDTCVDRILGAASFPFLSAVWMQTHALYFGWGYVFLPTHCLRELAPNGALWWILCLRRMPYFTTSAMGWIFARGIGHVEETFDKSRALVCIWTAYTRRIWSMWWIGANMIWLFCHLNGVTIIVGSRQSATMLYNSRSCSLYA